MSHRRAVALFLFAFGVAPAVERAGAVSTVSLRELDAGGRLFNAGPPPVTARVRIARDLPPLEIRLLPPAGPQESGVLELSRPGEPAAFQTIAVRGPGGTERLARFTRVEDANFDGYADLLVASDGGADWVGYEFYFFDPAHQSFVQDDLAHEMSARLRGSELEIQRITGGITLRRRDEGCRTGFVWLERFIVEDGHLAKVEEQEHREEKEGCFVVQRRRSPGGMVEIARYPVVAAAN